MKVPYSWLREYCDPGVEPGQLAEADERAAQVHHDLLVQVLLEHGGVLRGGGMDFPHLTGWRKIGLVSGRAFRVYPPVDRTAAVGPSHGSGVAT